MKLFKFRVPLLYIKIFISHYVQMKPFLPRLRVDFAYLFISHYVQMKRAVIFKARVK